MTRTTTEEILEIIREMPGVTSGNIVELMPHANKQSIYAALNAQYIRGNLIRSQAPAEGKGRPAFLWSIAPAGTKPPVVKKKKKVPSKPYPYSDEYFVGLEKVAADISATTIQSLRNQVAALETWKTEAIARYPDLAVDPIILKARNIVAEELDASDRDAAAQVRAGKRDGVLAMRLVVKMLEGSV